MSEPVANEWSVAPLGHVATVAVGGTPSTDIPEFWGGSIPWMTSGDIHLRRIRNVGGRITKRGLKGSNAKLIRPRAVAIALAGQGKTRGTAALTEIELCTNQSVALVSPDERKLLPEFLFHWLVPRYEELRASSSGGGRGGLTKAILERFSVAFPSLNEQHRIADLLSALDEQVECSGQRLAKYRLLRAGLYQAMLNEFTPTAPIGVHFTLRSGTTPARTQEDYYRPDGVPWVKTLDLNEGELSQTDEGVSPRALAECSLRVHAAGTVLVAMYGGWEQIGRTALLATPACTNQAITALLPQCQSRWDPYFVLKALQALRHKWRGYAVSTRKDPNITKSDVARFLLPAPPLEQQVAWARRLRAVDTLISSEEALSVKTQSQARAAQLALLCSDAPRSA